MAQRTPLSVLGDGSFANAEKLLSMNEPSVLTSIPISELAASIALAMSGHGVKAIEPATHIAPLDEVLSPGDACKLLKITAPTLRSYRDRGYFSVHRMGNRAYYLRSEVMDGLKKAGKAKNSRNPAAR